MQARCAVEIRNADTNADAARAIADAVTSLQSAAETHRVPLRAHLDGVGGAAGSPAFKPSKEL